jgi:hypothetical protein
MNKSQYLELRKNSRSAAINNNNIVAGEKFYDIITQD